MRNLKPKLTIDKFTGAGDGLLYYNEGFLAGNENGNSLLTEKFKFEKYFDSTDTNFAGNTDYYYETQTMISLTTKSGTRDYNLLVNNVGEIFIKQSSSYYNGLLYNIANLGTYPDIVELASGNLLLSASSSTSSWGHLLIRGRCANGSSTTKIIDGEGRDLLALGAATKYVQNINTGEIYDIVSISTTNSTNDTLNFTAGVANSEDQEFIIYVTGKFQMTEDTYKRRQVKQSGNRYFIINGNKLAMLSDNETTFNQAHRTFPSGYKALSFDVNAGKQLFSAKNDTGGSMLILWDEFSDGWNNIINLDGDVYCVKAYQSGWIYVLRGVIYYTDGFSVQKISSYSDNVTVGRAGVDILQPTNFNGIEVFNEIIYFVNTSNSNNYSGMRTEYGVYAFDSNSGWSFLGGFLDSKQLPVPTFIKLTNNTLYVGFWLYYTKTEAYRSGVSIIREGAYTDTSLNKSFISYIDLKDETQIFGIGLNLSFDSDIAKSGFDSFTASSTSITVSIGDGNKQLMKNYYGEMITSSVISISKFYDVIDEGDQLRITSHHSLNNGKRTFVTGKTLTDTDIQLTVSPTLTAEVGESTELKIIKVKKCATKTITENQLNTEHLFFLPVPLFTNKIFIEVVVNGIANSMPISITGINVY